MARYTEPVEQPTEMELGLSEEQTLLQDTVRELCQHVFPLSALRETEKDPDGFDRSFWARLCDMGLPGMLLAEDVGGHGMGLLETALVFEQLGRQLATTPLFSSSILAAPLIAACGDAATRDRWLPAIAQGAVVAVAAAAPEGSSDTAQGGALFVRTGDMVRISGITPFVPFASVASALLVIGREQASGALAAVILPPEAPGIALRRQETLATEPYFEVVLTDVMRPATDLLLAGDLRSSWRNAMFRGFVMSAAQAVGAARHIHEISVAYAKDREAFGQPIGGFQAIAHYLADAIVEIEGCQTLVHQAAWLHDNGRAFEAQAAMAKLQACAMFRRVSAMGVQVHGGIGYTSEADPQLFFRRAKQWQVLHGDEAFLEDEIARLTIDGHADV